MIINTDTLYVSCTVYSSTVFNMHSQASQRRLVGHITLPPVDSWENIDLSALPWDTPFNGEVVTRIQISGFSSKPWSPWGVLGLSDMRQVLPIPIPRHCLGGSIQQVHSCSHLQRDQIIFLQLSFFYGIDLSFKYKVANYSPGYL